MQIPNSSKPCGIVHVDPSGSETYLPLEYAEVHADVIDVSALVTISQHFWQYSPSGLTKAKYVFPVPARAAVCGFEMIAEDGTVITAVVKEKEEARREHQEAMRQGVMTGLVEHVTDDIFSISLGALPGQQVITTRVTYVLDLMGDDMADQIRLQLPMCIGMRYGIIPEGMIGSRAVPPNRIHISVDVRMQGAVKKIASPTHPTVVISPNEPEQIPQTAQYTSEDFLTQDFVLIVTADGLDAPRCFAQRAPNGTIAMQLNIMPKFNLPPVPRQEYLFLVDRSGSMTGKSIETAKRALVMLLRALPRRDTWFNIFSFGRQSDSLWPQSVPYDEKNLLQATEHVDTMSANYGGTVMRGALENVFASRKTDTPTAVFVLTDGQVQDVNQTVAPVEQAVQQAARDAPVRVFTLGIGRTTSTAMCEGISRAGNGICLMATTAETIIGKCSRLVRASRTYVLKNVSVDWGVRTDLAEAYRTGNTELAGVRQAPAEISSLYPGNRFVVFALVQDEAFTPPKEVVIRAQRDGYGEVLQFSVPVQVVEFPPEHHPQPLLQTLAARRAIMDLEDGSRTTVSPEAKSLITHLGTQYQLASKYTSFVAVDKRTRAEIGERLVEGPRDADLPAATASAKRRMVRRPIATEGRGGSSALAMARGPTGAARVVSSMSRRAPTYPQVVARPRPAQFPSNISSHAQPKPTNAEPVTLRRNLLTPDATSTPPPPPPPPAAVDSQPQSVEVSWMPPESWDAAAAAAAAEDSDSSSDSGVRSRGTKAGIPQHRSSKRRHLDQDSLAATTQAEDKVLPLIRLQSFDGSFPADDRLLALLDASVSSFAETHGDGVPDAVWATVLAVVWLRTHLTDEPELLESLVEKAMEFVSQTAPGVDADGLLARAQEALSVLVKVSV